MNLRLVTGMARSKRAVEVLTGNLLMLMVMAAVFSSIAFIVKSSSDEYSRIQEEQIVRGISTYLKSKVSEAWGVGADEVALNLPQLTGGARYAIESDASGNFLTIRTAKATYRMPSSGVTISKRGISSTESHTIGIRDGRVVINPAPLTQIVYPLDGSVFKGSFNVSYRTSNSATQHSIYLDGRLVANSTASLDGFIIDPGLHPTSLADGQHVVRVVSRNSFGEGADLAHFVVDRVPPQVDLNTTQIYGGELRLSVTEVRSESNRIEIYIFVTDQNSMPVRELDANNFYMYNSQDEFLQGGRYSISVIASDSGSRVDPRSYAISTEYRGKVETVRERAIIWDSKTFNETTVFRGKASDIAGNEQTSDNVTRTPTHRDLEVGAPDRKFDLSVIFTNDVSGSMEWVMWKDELPKPGEESRLDFMKAAVKSFIDRMFPEDEGAICSFSTNYEAETTEIILRADFTNTDDSGKAYLAAVIDGLTTRDGTPLYDALYQSVLWVKERSKFKAVVVLTDGKDLNYATGLPYSNHTSEEVIDLAVQESVPIYSVGLGEEDKVDVGVLTLISEQTGGRFYLAPTPEKLQEAYDQIAGELLSGYKVTYWPGFQIAGGETITLVVYDKKNRSGMIEITAPAPEGG